MKLWIYILMFLFAYPCYAQLKGYEHLFDIDLNENVPLIWRLKKEYEHNNSSYDWHYKFSWQISSVFDYKFKQNIHNFGSIEKRIDNPDEESILADLKRTPKAFYPYIGPLLYTVRGLSGKVLDLPGIKGTKNKFPDKIASRLQNIPDIEFASPDMYIFLSPQFWGEDMASLEFLHEPLNKQPKTPKIRIDPEFMKKMKQQVNINAYAKGKSPNTTIGHRHILAGSETPLSTADVRAFINTFDNLKNFSTSGNNGIRLILIEPLINYWDTKNGTNENVAMLKGIVNPCQSLVRRVKWSSLGQKFQDSIGVEGFGLNEWAYTCDKVIKAYRVSSIPSSHIGFYRNLKKGLYYKALDKISQNPREKQQTRYFLEAIAQMFSTTENDLKAVRPFRMELRQKLNALQTEKTGTLFILP